MGGANHHREQCELIPEIIDPKKHGVHLSPCYKKITQIISKEKKKSSSSLVLKSCKKATLQKYESDRPLKRKRLQTGKITKDIYPRECNICKQYLLKRNKKLSKPKKCVTKQSEKTIKDAAKNKNDDMYYEIKDLDLIAKEFKYHICCYKNFTKKTETVDKKDNKFEAVVTYIENEIITGNKAISMNVLGKIYGGTRRQYLKKKIIDNFSTKLQFISIDSKNSEIVVNSELSNLK